jgi:hypothetical protein
MEFFRSLSVVKEETTKLAESKGFVETGYDDENEDG